MKLRSPEMSWTNKETGRPKEQGGHKRIDIAVDKSTLDVLKSKENKSNYIEYCVNATAYSRKIRFHETNTTTNGDHTIFETAARFAWEPTFSQDNAVLETFCYFAYQCMGEGFSFRIRINEITTSAVDVAASNVWTASQVFNGLTFSGGMALLPNQSRYEIEFQFRPVDSSSVACVRDVNIILDVIDGLPEWFDEKARLPFENCEKTR